MVTNEDIGGQTRGHVIKPLKIKKTQNFNNRMIFFHKTTSNAFYLNKIIIK